MLQITFDRLIESHWETVEMDCVTFERKGTAIDIHLPTENPAGKTILVEPVRNIKVFSDVENKRIEGKWKAGVSGEQKGYGLFQRSEGNLLARIGIDDGKPLPVQKESSLLICSFCKKEVERIRATFGIGRLEVAKEYEKTSDPTYYKLVTHVGVNKVVACPDCCLEVKPIMHKVKGADGIERLEIKAQNCTTYSEG